LSFATTRLWIGLQELAQAILMLFAGAGEISGIVGIIAIGGSQFGSTLAGLLTFSVAINMNLAIFNLLPLPPLDGGRIAFAVLEKMYRPLARIQAPLTLAAWAFMLALMVYATIQDLGRVGPSVLT
jgi:regulator of sigma E protease